MKVLGFNITRSRTVPEQKSLSTAALSWLRADDLDRGGAVLTNAYQQVVWVYRAINVLAEQVANIPFLFSHGERGREHLITRGPLIDFYARPHPQINHFQYWELRIIWLMLRGESFRVPIFENARAGAGGGGGAHGRILKRVLILNPDHFQHLVENHQLVGWRYTGLGPNAPLSSQVFLPEEVWFEKLPNPFDFWRGLSPLYAASTAARTDFAAGAFMRGIIENNADAGVIVRADKPLAPEQQEQLFAALRERKRRAGTADQPLLITGCAEIIKPQLSSSDLQFLENRKFSRAEICAAFGVPEEILTATDHAKYDVMQGARLNFIENRVAPLCGRLESEEQRTVKSIDPDAIGWFDLDSLPILQQARRERLIAAKTGFEMGIPFNELNRVLDLGFKALPWGDSGYLSSKLRPIERPQASFEEKLRSRELNERSDSVESMHSTEPLERLERWLGVVLNGEPSAHLFSQPGSAPLKLKARRLRRYLFEQRGRVLGALSSLAAADGTMNQAPASLLEGTRWRALFDIESENQRLRSVIGMAAQERWNEAGEPCAALNQKISDTLQDSFQQGLRLGETISQLIDRARTVYNRLGQLEERALTECAQTMCPSLGNAAANQQHPATDPTNSSS